MEQTLSVRRLLILAEVLFGALPRLVQLPVAAQNEENGDLHPENDSGRGERRGKVLDALVLSPLGRARARGRRGRGLGRVGHGVACLVIMLVVVAVGRVLI